MHEMPFFTTFHLIFLYDSFPSLKREEGDKFENICYVVEGVNSVEFKQVLI